MVRCYVVYSLSYVALGRAMQLHVAFDSRPEAEKWLKLPGNEDCEIIEVNRLSYPELKKKKKK